MEEFTVRSDSVNVQEIMRRIRSRIAEKRGVDYTEEEIRHLATIKLEKFLDPKQIRSDLVKHYQQLRTIGSLDEQRSLETENKTALSSAHYRFEDGMVYGSSRRVIGILIRGIRGLLSPILKLFFNLGPIVKALRVQSEINDRNEQLDALHFEVLNNLVVEVTRLGIDVKNYKMRVESVSSRLDFDERRARALENVVQYKSGTQASDSNNSTEKSGEEKPATAGGAVRRRRRGRRRLPKTAEKRVNATSNSNKEPELEKSGTTPLSTEPMADTNPPKTVESSSSITPDPSKELRSKRSDEPPLEPKPREEDTNPSEQ